MSLMRLWIVLVLISRGRPAVGGVCSNYVVIVQTDRLPSGFQGGYRAGGRPYNRERGRLLRDRGVIARRRCMDLVCYIMNDGSLVSLRRYAILICLECPCRPPRAVDVNIFLGTSMPTGGLSLRPCAPPPPVEISRHSEARISTPSLCHHRDTTNTYQLSLRRGEAIDYLFSTTILKSSLEI